MNTFVWLMWLIMISNTAPKVGLYSFHVWLIMISNSASKVGLYSFYGGTVATIFGSSNLQSWPYVQKFHIHLLTKTLVSKIDLKYNPLSMEPQERESPSTIPMSSIERSRWFVYLSHKHHSMVRWIPPSKGFHEH